MPLDRRSAETTSPRWKTTFLYRRSSLWAIRRNSRGSMPSRDRKPCISLEAQLRGVPVSHSSTLRLQRPSVSAALRPAGPAPTITTSHAVRAITAFEPLTQHPRPLLMESPNHRNREPCELRKGWMFRVPILVRLPTPTVIAVLFFISLAGRPLPSSTRTTTNGRRTEKGRSPLSRPCWCIGHLQSFKADRIRLARLPCLTASGAALLLFWPCPPRPRFLHRALLPAGEV